MHTGAGRASSRKAEPPGSAASSQQTYHRAIAPDRLREQVAHRHALPQSARPSQPPRDSSAAKACCTDDRQEKATQEGGVLYPKPQPELDPGFSPTELDCQLYTRSIGGHVHQMSRLLLWATSRVRGSSSEHRPARVVDCPRHCVPERLHQLNQL